MFCRLRQCRQILPKLILLPYLLFFFYVHNVSFFRLPCPPLGCYGDQRLRPLPNNSECEPKRTNSIALLFLSNQIKSVSFSIWHSI